MVKRCVLGFFLALLILLPVVSALDVAFIATTQGIRVIDVTNEAAPNEIGSYPSEKVLRDIVVVGNIAYVLGDVFLTLNVSNQSSPELLGSIDLNGGYGLDIQENYAYLAMDDQGLKILDISNPSFPQTIGTYTDCIQNKDVRVNGDYAYLACGVSELQVINIKDKTRPQKVSTGYTFGVSPWGVDMSRAFSEFFEQYSFESENMPIVQSGMTQDFVLAKESDGLADVVKKMNRKKFGVAAVMKGKNFLGTVTEKEICGEIYNNPAFVRKMSIGQLMSLNSRKVMPGTFVIDANKTMLDKKVHVLAVMEDKELVGIISQKNVVELLSLFIDTVTSTDDMKPV